MAEEANGLEIETKSREEGVKPDDTDLKDTPELGETMQSDDTVLKDTPEPETAIQSDDTNQMITWACRG